MIIVITDTHFGHDKLISYGRPKHFDSIIIHNLHRVIYDALKQGEPVMIIHLGDFSLGRDGENANLWRRITQGCTTVLIRGNHDNRKDSWYKKHAGFNYVNTRLEMRVFGKKCVFTHHPIAREKGVDMNIHGHLHGNHHRLHEMSPGFYQHIWHYDCAPDLHDYKPLNLNDIVLNRKSYSHVIHLEEDRNVRLFKWLSRKLKH